MKAVSEVLGGDLLKFVECMREPVFTRPFFLFAPFAGHPSSSPFLGTFFRLRKVLCSAEQRAQCRAWRGAGMDLSTKFGKEIPSRNLREKGYVLFMREHPQSEAQVTDLSLLAVMNVVKFWRQILSLLFGPTDGYR